MPDNLVEVKRLLTEITQPDRYEGGYHEPPFTVLHKRIAHMKQLAQDALDLLEVDRIEKESA